MSAGAPRLPRSEASREGDVLSSRMAEITMTLGEERCPTCDGSGVVARSHQRYPCPTCSPSDAGAPYSAIYGADHGSGPRIVRSAAYALGAAGVVAMLALLLKALWH